MAKEFIYNKVKGIGTVGSKTIEIGSFTVDGKENKDKIYLVDHFTKRDGTEGSKATALCTIEEAKAIGELLITVTE